MGKIGWIIRLAISFVISVIATVSVVVEKEQATILDILSIPLMVIITTPAILVGLTLGQYALMLALAAPEKDLWEPKK